MEGIDMSRRSTGRSFIGLAIEIGLIALVVALIPKLDLKPTAADSNAAATAQPAHDPWWRAQPAARPTAWRPADPPQIDVEQTLDDASRRLMNQAADYASRAAANVLAPPAPLPTSPDWPPQIEAQPRDWPRY